FCLQRIEQAKIAQKVKAGASGAVEVADGTFQAACQQACPAEAIAFGNIRDSHSRVAQAKANERTYVVLDYLDTKPRVTYLARVRNPNPDMPDHQPMPYSTDEFLKGGGMMQTHAAGGGAYSAGHGATGQKGAH
ncbi:MAG: TAT-variant-translocated molybdopterin oxidoreductase, partial [Limisphaerales bacterium]